MSLESCLLRRGKPQAPTTQRLLALSAIVCGYWYVFLGAGVSGYIVIRRAWRHPGSRRRIDTWMHAVPFQRDLLKGLAVSRFAQVLGLSLRSGVILLDGQEMAGSAAPRPLLMADAEKIREQVNHGGRLADVFMTWSYLPSFTRRMRSAGEEAAELPKMCLIVGRHYDREAAHLDKNVSTVIEPIVIVGLAGVVLMIALAIFLSMWNMAALIR